MRKPILFASAALLAACTGQPKTVVAPTVTVTVTQKVIPSGPAYPYCKDIFRIGNTVTTTKIHTINCMINRNLLTVIPLIRCRDGSYLGSMVDAGYNGYFIAGKKYVAVKGKVDNDKTYGKIYWKCLGK